MAERETPKEGGSYLRKPDGSLELVEQTKPAGKGELAGEVPRDKPKGK